ncbi:hypothetical protein ACFQYP_00460 [Nonomuraea antimicrobica]
MISLVEAIVRLFKGDFKGALDVVVKAVTNLGETMISAGKDLLNGLWDGIQQLAGWLKGKILDFFKNILPGWVQDALGISSPSKVFMQMGRMLPAGMAVGIRQASGLVRTQLDRMTAMAAGTVMPSMAVPGVSVPSGMAGGGLAGRTVIHQTNYYPQAEPSSATVNRGLQLAGALGVI